MTAERIAELPQPTAERLEDLRTNRHWFCFEEGGLTDLEAAALIAAAEENAKLRAEVERLNTEMDAWAKADERQDQRIAALESEVASLLAEIATWKDRAKAARAERDAAVREERESCAKVCEEQVIPRVGDVSFIAHATFRHMGNRSCAAAIRLRGTTGGHTMKREDVERMSGRELDAMISERVLGIPVEWKDQFTHTGPVVPCVRQATYKEIPEYSVEEGLAFFAMIAAVREKGWWPTMELTSREVWTVNLAYLAETLGKCPADVEVDAPTLPLAFSRAALLTTIPEGQ